MSQKQSARVLLYLFFIGLALLMLASLAIRPASGAEPTGRIGAPISTTKPPAEPRLTMPPTDTE